MFWNERYYIQSMGNILHSHLKTQKKFCFLRSDSKIFSMLTKKNIEHRPSLFKSKNLVMRLWKKNLIFPKKIIVNKYKKRLEIVLLKKKKKLTSPIESPKYVTSKGRMKVAN